jgi:hypothetical protein
MEINNEIVEKYLKDPNNCPFCENKKGEGLRAENDDIIPDNSALWRNVSCKDCGREWVEEFELTTISNLTESKLIL